MSIEVGQPSGYQPDGYQPDGSAVAVSSVYVPRHRTIVLGASTCGQAKRAISWPQARLPAEPSRFRLDFLVEVEKLWQRRFYTAGERIRAGGLDALCTVGGHAGLTEPRWSPVVGSIVSDGSCTWVMQTPTVDSLIDVSTITWELPSGITISGQQDGDADTSAVPAGGESGKQYAITIKVRDANGEGFDQPCILHVE